MPCSGRRLLDFPKGDEPTIQEEPDLRRARSKTHRNEKICTKKEAQAGERTNPKTANEKEDMREIKLGSWTERKRESGTERKGD